MDSNGSHGRGFARRPINLAKPHVTRPQEWTRPRDVSAMKSLNCRDQREPKGVAAFEGRTTFHETLLKEVRAYFARKRIGRKGDRRVHIKLAILLMWWITSYWLLVFRAHNLGIALLLTLPLSLSIAGLAFNVCHDAMHNSFFSSWIANYLLSTISDILGTSSYLWRWKHNVFHHGYTNMIGIDTDVNPNVFRGLSEDLPLVGVAKLQHVYLWFCYGLVVLKWQLFGDFRGLFVGRIGDHVVRRPKNVELAVFVAGKVLFVLWVFGIPLLYHSFRIVSLFYLLTAFELGLVFSIVFQLAHCVEGTTFVLSKRPGTGGSESGSDWAVHQIEATADFSQNSMLTWYLGGLNYQIEHHLFPNICHIHYPALAPLIKKCCAQYGIRYKAHRTLIQALASHFRFLRYGRP